MKRTARIARLEGSLRASTPAGHILYSGRTPAQVDEEIFRELLEREVENAKIRREIEFAQPAQNAETGILLIALGYTNDEEGWQDFCAEERVWFAVRKHALQLPHLCAEFCPMGGSPNPQSKREHEFYLADVQRHLDWLNYMWQPSLVTAVALYDYVERRGMGGLESILCAFDELQQQGAFPEVKAGEMSHIVPKLWQEWRKPKDQEARYLVELDHQKIRTFVLAHQVPADTKRQSSNSLLES